MVSLIPLWSDCIISTEVDSQIAHKIPYLGYPLSPGHEMPCYKKMIFIAVEVVYIIPLMYNIHGRSF